MLVLLNETVARAGQVLAAGVLADLPDVEAELLIGRGSAMLPGAPLQAVTVADPALDGLIDVPPARPRRRSSGTE